MHSRADVRIRRRRLLIAAVAALAVGCGVAMDEPAVDPTVPAAHDSIVTSTAELLTKPSQVAATPTGAANPTATAEHSNSALEDAFAAAGAEVDFELAVPSELVGLTIIDEGLRISGPPTQPAAIATFIDNTASPPRYLSFGQIAGGFGKFPESETTDSVTVQGNDATLNSEPNQAGDVNYQLRWQSGGITYDIGTSNVSLEDLLVFAESLSVTPDAGATSTRNSS